MPAAKLRVRWRAHLPLNPADLNGADAVIFITDTDGKQHRYW
jgi:hypothetical protein